MRVAEVFKTANFADLDFAASALYLLAAPSTPEPARETALKLANQGETITYSKAKDLVERYKQSQQDPSWQTMSENDADEAIGNEPVPSFSSQIESLPNVEISRINDLELQITISYVDVNLSITGKEDNLTAFLEETISNPRIINDMVQQIKSQIDTQAD
ncbi:MAG: hypothetical protein Tsb0014_41130 [Pleurocapsa sp.]